MKPSLLGCAVVFVCCAAHGQGMAAAKIAAHLGQVDVAVAALQGSPRTAEADALLCELYMSVDEQDAAIKACEAASAAAPANSVYVLQLARAYGAKAGSSGTLTGMRLVGKIRGNFERAVQLNGSNVEALSDLGQFYVEAPAVAGGSIDKARALVGRLQPLSPARAHRLAAMVAAKNKNDEGAEQEYRAELAVAQSPEAYVDLANFYRGRKQWEKAVSAAKLALERDSHHGPDTLDAAQLLIGLKQSPHDAQAALRDYLKAPQGPVASYAKADVLLAHSLQDTGDAAGAKAAYQAALSLARDYAPARQGLAR